MADQPFWSGGSMPGEAELRNYLSRNTGLTAEEIANVVSKYRDDVLSSTNPERDWPQMAVNSWVSTQVEGVMTNPTRTDNGAGPTAVEDVVATNQREDSQRAQKFQALADMASQRMQRQTQSWYDQANVLNDAGSNTGAALATSIALGVRTDEFGNVMVDPQTGQAMPIDAGSMWQEVQRLRFNFGQLFPDDPTTFRHGGQRVTSTRDRTIRGVERGEPEQIARRNKNIRGSLKRDTRSSSAPPVSTAGRGGARQQRYLMSPSQALGMLNAMDPDELTHLQQEMYEAGLYGESVPSWGRADSTTRSAFINMLSTAAQDTQEPIDAMLNRMADERINRQEAVGGAGGSGGGGGSGGLNLPSFAPEVTSAETLSQSIDEISQNLFGRFGDPEKKKALIAQLQGKEEATQRTNYDRTVADLYSQAGAGQKAADEGAGGDEIDAFMAAIGGKESGGNYGARNADSGASGKYQIMPKNWPAWAERAGLGRNAPQTPENQEIVARRTMLDYFEQFGNWRDVAVAWYAGPGRVNQVRNSTRGQGRYPSIAAYADDVMARFGQQKTGQAPDGSYTGPTTGGAQYGATERFDPAAEAEAILKAQDPVGWQGHEYAQRAIDFYGLLGGVV